jgi:hypothetical protein
MACRIRSVLLVVPIVSTESLACGLHEGSLRERWLLLGLSKACFGYFRFKNLLAFRWL